MFYVILFCRIITAVLAVVAACKLHTSRDTNEQFLFIATFILSALFTLLA